MSSHAGQFRPRPIPDSLDVRARALADAIDWRRTAERHVADVLKRDFPVGARVHFEYGGRNFWGDVLRHSDDRLEVRNVDTGRKRWIYAERLLSVARARS